MIEQQGGIFVGSGKDRLGQKRAVFGTLPMVYKVTGRDTGGRLLVIEQENAVKGGPPRHLHHEQDEWFYVIAGDYIVEAGGQTFRLGPGDSVLAPRRVPHLWAHVGEGTGRLLITFLPAGDMEAFFTEATKIKGDASAPPAEAMAKLFHDHGMEMVGPPLSIAGAGDERTRD